MSVFEFSDSFSDIDDILFKLEDEDLLDLSGRCYGAGGDRQR